MATPVLTAKQPDATTALQQPLTPPDPEALRRMGAGLASRFIQYESDRRLAELKWERNARQYLGIYDPEIESRLDTTRSRAYPKVTRVKCVSMLSRLMNLLFPADDKNWTVAPSAVPNLDETDLQTVLDTLMPPPDPSAGMAAPGMPAPPAQGPMPTDEQIEQAIREFARKRAARMELEIEDQLQELGGNRMLDYVALCRKVLASGIQYGVGVLRGPFVEEQKQRKWQIANGRLQATEVTAYRPRFEWVPVWDYYPDMAAKHLSQMDGQFLRQVMSRHQLVMLKQRPDFMADQIDKFLAQSPTGNYRRKPFETEIRAMGVQVNVTQAELGKFEAIIWDGYIPGRDLAAAGANVPEKLMEQDVRAEIWIMGDIVIKAQLDPWSQLDTDGEMPQFHHFIFEEDESFLLGNGLPAIVRDSQMGICAATRMLLDNGSVMRNIEVNTTLIRLDTDVTSLQPDKIWYREDESPATLQYPAVRVIDLPMHLPELQGMVKLFQEFADQETFVNAATGGDMQRGPSEPFRTAAGASMLRGDAALPFKDVVRNFDIFTESVMGALLVFNRNFNPDPAIRGDFQPVARGATSLIAKEVLGIQLDSLAQTLTEGEKKYVKMRELARARVRVRDLDSEDLVMDDAACDAIDKQESDRAQQQQELMTEAMKAQVRETLSAALKNLSAAGKNSAQSEAVTANLILAALEKGVNPDQLSAPGAQNGQSESQPSSAGAQPGGGSGGDGAGIPAGTGVGGFAAASGSPAAGGGQGFAAMPAQ